MTATGSTPRDVPGRPVYTSGFSWRKRRYLARFLQCSEVRELPDRWPANGATLYLWGSTPVPPQVPAGAKVVRVEDGFLRSVGLGADLVQPLSWVLDPVGIYYDARHPSELEQLLQHARFTPDELTRAAALRQRIVAAGLTKYNLAHPAWQRPASADCVVLVPGQVESDASIATGALGLRSNMALLQAVRAARPAAWLVYKPHPDVAAGLRAAGTQDGSAGQWCDEVVTDVGMQSLLPQVDEVHVITSLTGFEALLRGKRVCCWGHPFYAGFGLTQDATPHPCRGRPLTLDELVAGALLRYPTYLSRRTGRPCSAELALDELMDWRHQSSGQPAWWQRLMRPWLARP